MPIKHVHGTLMSPDSLWAKRKIAGDAAAKNKPPTPERSSSNMDADNELDEDDDIDVDSALRRADKYAPVSAELEDENVDENEEEDEDEDEDEEEDEDEDEEEDEDEDESEEDADDERIDTEDDDEIVDSAVEHGNSDDNAPEEDEETASESSNSENEDLTMADKKISMSDHVRREIDKRKNSGDSLRGVDIVAALAKRNINVSAAQVSQLLKKAGVAPGKQGRKPKNKPELGAGETARFTAKNKSKTGDEPRTRRAAPVVTAKPRSSAPERVLPKLAPKPAVESGGETGMLDAAQRFYAACGHDADVAARFLRAAEAVHSALTD